MGKTTTFALAFTLEERDVEALNKQSNVQQTGQQLLEAAARGGKMLPPEWAKRVEAAIGTLDPQAIAEAVEKSAGKDGEATLVYWRVDPSQINFYKHLAENQGVTLEQQLKSILDYAYMQGWFGMGAPDVFKILLTPEQWRWLQQRFGKDIPTGEDVIGLLQTYTPGQAEEVDPVLAALDPEVETPRPARRGK